MTQSQISIANLKHFRGLVVDLDGTLYSQSGIRLVMGIWLLLGGLSQIRKLSRFRRTMEIMRGEQESGTDDSNDGLLISPFDRQIQRCATTLELPEKQLRSTVETWMIRRPCRWLRLFRNRHLIRILREFRENGGKLAVLSDYPAKAKLTALGIDDLFDVCISSGETASLTTMKPSTDGLQMALEELDVGVADAGLIGDREDVDGEVARRLGIAFFLV